ncbi:PLC-like phosphodiesterase [Mrakia frigida]|uniref:PLC-like phosphodiesterase n=1 Tax=Mrakia frigida TaxID=29902 RepID=UPI003FCBF6A2
MLKVSAKKIQQRTFKLDGEKGTIEWGSKKGGFVNIESIRELRLTTSARSFIDQLSLSSPSPSSSYLSPSYLSRWITIIYTAADASSSSSSGELKWKTLHMVAPSPKAFEEWSGTLQALWEARRELMGGIGALAGVGVGEKEGWLDFEGVVRVCRRLNIASSRADLLARFKEADVDGRGHLDFVAFQRFVQKLKRRMDIEALFETITGSGLDEGEFGEWLRSVQKVSFFFFFPPETIDPSPLILLDGFTSFLTSSDNSVFAEQTSKVTHDMTRPLAEYFISSSHNTYLIGHQLVGESTVEGYIRALLQGCRSVELDCWDGDAGEPVIYHGRTFTGKVTVRDVVHAIGKYAFVASPYPVIISAEIHCCVEQQEVLVKTLKEILGQRFLDEPLKGWEGKEGLPSPEELKYRILLKVSSWYVKLHIGCLLRPRLDSRSPFRFSGRRSSNTGLVSRVRRRLSLQSSSSSESSHDSFTLVHASTSPSLPPVPSRSPTKSKGSSSSSSPPPKPTCSPALAKTLIYTLGVKYRGFNKKETYLPSHMVSLSERTANKVLKQSFGDVVKHNRTHLMRLYPSVTRLTSSNYDPIRYWAAGAQLVAINWQSTDLGYTFNGAMFARNGRAGYVLKPPPLRIKVKEEQFGRVKHSLKVKVISAQQLPNPGDFVKRDSMIDPFVEITVFLPSIIPSASSSSTPATSASQPTLLSPPASPALPVSVSKPSIKLKTKTIEDNGFNPVWNETLAFDFECAEGMEDLVFVRFDVRYEGEVVEMLDKSVGAYCVSLGSLNKGYRHLPLQDQHLNQFLFSSVFVHLDLVSSSSSSSSLSLLTSPPRSFPSPTPISL